MTTSTGRAGFGLPLMPIAMAAALLAGCVATGAGSSASPSPASSDSIASPGGSDLLPGPSSSAGKGGSEPGGPSGSGGPDAPVSTAVPAPPSGVVPAPSPALVTPGPVVGETHPVFVHGLSAAVRMGHVVARLEWVSGVAPCTVLAGVDVARAGSQFTLTAREGAGRVDVACIEIAVEKATEVDLGPLPAGRYVVSATPGDAPGVTVVVA